MFRFMVSTYDIEYFSWFDGSDLSSTEGTCVYANTYVKSMTK